MMEPACHPQLATPEYSTAAERRRPLSTASLLLTAPCATPHAAELTRLRREDAGSEGRETEVANWAGLLATWK